MDGYAGQILRINLTERKVGVIPTQKYEHWVGGHGMGSAIFWDLVKDKTIDGFDPANVVTLMTSPLSGTLVPAASGRTEVQGIGVQSYPIGWFTRSNFGGRFSSMLKSAGWDGIVLEGKANEPVWIDVRNEKVTIRNAGRLWGMDTWQTQQEIWGEVMKGQNFNGWMMPDPKKNDERTTQKPAVLTIGPAGENLSRLAILIHDASNAAGQGGFGAVWGSKNLKAISIIGTGGVKIHDPKALITARLWQKNNYAFKFKKLRAFTLFNWKNLKYYLSLQSFHSSPWPMVQWGMIKQRPDIGQRPQACVGCHSGCRARYEDGVGNEASCMATSFYWQADSIDIKRNASDLINKYGLNAAEMTWGLFYLELLKKRGLLNSADIPKCPLDISEIGSIGFLL